MRASFLLAAAFSVGSLAAHDHSHHLHARRGDVCATDCTVKRVLKAIKFLPDAAEICRSLLRLPGTVTQTAVETPTVIVSVAVSTFTVSDPNCAPTVKARGGVSASSPPGVSLLRSLTAFPSSAISSACSCLGVSPEETVTATKRADIPATSTVEVVATVTLCTSCTPPGGKCDLSDPGACCNQTCINADPFPTCA